uniref:Protein kinase domain-containing protein n=1 Tax=Phaeomonas parva TaxID=124430 RepID=A0A6U4G8K4_9STRA|mmetsp:Transcript_29383/g.94318  ORF Transcript_29383/g.94318 Transcript_29383/m.94318 type:complete len:916 (+) Transcript_29383:271-3018(+)
MVQILGLGLPPLPAAARAAASALASQQGEALEQLRAGVTGLAAVVPEPVATATTAATAPLKPVLAAASAALVEVLSSEQVSTVTKALSDATQTVLNDEEARLYAIVIGAPLLTFLTIMLMAALLSPRPGSNASKAEALEILRRERKAIEDGLPTVFEPNAVARYFSQRVLEVTVRQTQLLLIAGGVVARIIFDGTVLDKEAREERAPKRAQELVDAITKLGPAFIKIGQALSIRPDFLPAPYPEYLAQLQDGVKPFDSAVAVAILEEELGCNVEDVFISGKDAFTEPIASASLGQVYKTSVKNAEGEIVPVAVKVQRPGLLESCTRDLIVSRAILNLIARIAGEESRVGRNAKSTISIIDVYGARFIDELDYDGEAGATARLGRDLAGVDDLADVVTVPGVFRSSRHTIVTEWLDGVKITSIDTSDAAEKERVENYVNVLLNVYLAQLLETGFLHSDPHPGNFLLLEDGRIGILDCGLMTEITKAQQDAMVKYVSHLSSKQFEKTLEDLIALGFLDPELSENEENRRIVAPIIAEVLSALSKGGGTAAFENVDRTSIDGVGEELKELGKKFPLQIPPYFALIIRAFSTLEGLGLQLDPKFSIVEACFPYLARRLLGPDTNHDRQLQESLELFLYGDELESDVATAVPVGGKVPQLDVTKLDELLDGYSSFKDRTAIIEDSVSAEKQAKLATTLIGNVFGEEGSYVEDVLVNEGVRLTDAVLREAVSGTLGVLANAPLRPPGIRTLASLAGATEDDEEGAKVVKKLGDLALTLADAQRDADVAMADGGDAGGVSSSGRSPGEAVVRANRFVKDRLLPKEVRDTALAYTLFEVLPGLAMGAAAASVARGGNGAKQSPNPAASGLALRDVAKDVGPAAARIGNKYTQRLRQRTRERLQQDIDVQRAATNLGKGRGTEV